MSFIGIEHIGIAAADTVALKDWYVKAFGLEVCYDNGKTPPTFFLRFPDGNMIEIYAIGTAAPHPASNKVQGIRHFAISVDDFDAACASLAALGVERLESPAPPTPALATFFFRDPEGNILHLIRRAKPL